MDISGIFRSLLFFFDKIIYRFIPIVYDFIMNLVGVSIFDESTIEKITSNIYALIGLFVVFRIAIILLNAIVNPDKLTDKQGGAAKIFTKFIIALFMIIAIPIGFDFLYDLQKNVLESRIFEKIFIGTGTSGGGHGNNIAKESLSSFLTCNEALLVRAETNSEAAKFCGDLETGFTEAFTPERGSKSFATLDRILNSKSKLASSSGTENVYVYDYNSPISTVAGVVILFMLISLCFDVAVRIVKLGFLEIISPIAVIGYVDPKGELFSKWLKMTISTYLNLFMRIASVSFVTFTFSIIDLEGGMKNLEGQALEGSTLVFAKIFIIIGLLIFAKEIPKMLSGLFGLSEGNMGSLNPFKKLGGMAGAGVIGGAVGGATALGMKGIGGLAGGIVGARASAKYGGSALAGFGQGVKTGFGNVKMKDAYKGGFKGIGKTVLGGTTGAWSKGRDYAASKAAGKEVKAGKFSEMKEAMADKATTMHTAAADRRATDRWSELKKAGPGNYYKNNNYKGAVNNVSEAKKKLIEAEKVRQLYANKYSHDPDGTFTGKDGNIYTYKQAYDISNENYISSQKNVDYYKNKLESMDKMPEYKEDAETRAFVERMEAAEKAKTFTHKDIPGMNDNQENKK